MPKIVIQLANVWSVVTGRVPLAEPHTCSMCRDVVTSLSRRQYRIWQEDLTYEDRPLIGHSCGGTLRPAGLRPSSVSELTGRTP